MKHDASAREPELFSVIVLHYNQEKYLYTALDSVLMQNYGKIELIIADDCTYRIDTDKIKSYIYRNMDSNIVNTIFMFNTCNQGTVKNVNNAVKAASGKYVLFFAADDCLWDSRTLNNYVKALESLPDDHYVACAQCHMLDENLDKTKGLFVNVPFAINLNNETAFYQYSKMAFSCLYAMGATAFKASVWEKFGYFDETYKIIEDWSYYLHLTHSGSKIVFFDFGGLKHRDGGVSHYNEAFNQFGPPPHIIEYKNDTLLIQEKEILPYLNELTPVEQMLLLSKYEDERKAFKLTFVTKKRVRRIDLVKKYKKLYFKRFVWSIIKSAQTIRKRLLNQALWLMASMLVLHLLLATRHYFTQVTEQFLPSEIFLRFGVNVAYGLFALDIAAYLFFAGLSVAYYLWKLRKDLHTSDY